MTSHGFQQWLQARKIDEADIFNLFYEATTKNPRWSDYLQNNGKEDFMRLVHENYLRYINIPYYGITVIIVILFFNK
jgi:hypothetical protein